MENAKALEASVGSTTGDVEALIEGGGVSEVVGDTDTGMLAVTDTEGVSVPDMVDVADTVGLVEAVTDFVGVLVLLDVALELAVDENGCVSAGVGLGLAVGGGKARSIGKVSVLLMTQVSLSHRRTPS